MPFARHPYRPSVLAELLRHGIVPRPHTPPARVREHLRDLYTFGLRELREQRREMERVLGPQPIEEHRRRVLALAARYPLLSLPVDRWLGDEEPSADLPPRSPASSQAGSS